MDDIEELEFRDGKRWVPKYLAEMMSGLDTYRLTYEEARQQANNASVRSFVNDRQDQFIDAHFKRMR